MPLQLYDKNVSGTLSATDSYYNLIIKNNNTGYDISGNVIPIPTAVPVTFNENRTVPYLHNPKDHFASVISFQLDTTTLPVFICEPVIGSSNINDTIYIFTILAISKNFIGVITTTIYKIRLQWSPDDLAVPVPTAPVADNYSDNPYYFSYSYQHFISLLNNQIANQWTTNGLLGNPPFLLFENGTISLYGDEAYMDIPVFDLNFNQSTYRLLFNTELYLLFSGLPADKADDSTPLYYNLNYELKFIRNISGLNLVTLYTDFTQTTSYLGIKMTCEYVPLSFWNPIDSIIITTNYLNTVPELVTSNLPTPGSDARVASNAEQYYILFDYMSPNYGASDYHPSINYEPNAEYRLTDMYGVGDVNQLEVRALWKDKWGILHTFTIESGSSSAIKLLFRKKKFYE
jgi:hypothetical protein